jgi:hypothetical protein
VKLLTIHSEAYQPLADITLPNKARYCDRWDIKLVSRMHSPGFTCWERPRIWLEELQGAGWLFFMGCDTLITNMRTDTIRFTGSNAQFIFAADGNGLQSDVWFMRECPETVDLLRRVCEHEHRRHPITGNEQDALNIELSGARDYSDYCRRVGNLKQGGEPPSPELLGHLERELSRSDVQVAIVGQRLLNAYPHLHYAGTGTEEHSWHPRDFVMHMPGKGLAERLQSFPNFPIYE